ncbi:MAG: metallophosphoesterase family protein [Kofleriaceae bacterium]|nr:metallophosphoesterase family protein [Kofleriaceae bacterium]
MPAFVRKSVTVPLRADGTARIVAVADTHSAPHEAIGKRLTALAPDAILHAGDVGDLSVLEELAAFAPLYAVRGNIDTRAHELPDLLMLDLEGGGRSLRALLVHIAVYGPKLRAEIARIARAEQAQLVVCGHSHVPFIGQERGITVFNPGSIGPRRFQLPIVFGTIDITPTAVKLAHVSCETGERWFPPG